MNIDVGRALVVAHFRVLLLACRDSIETAKHASHNSRCLGLQSKSRPELPDRDFRS
jgi:hypothetical protein